MSAPIAVVGATLHPMTGVDRVDDATVVIEGAKFAAVGEGLEPPAGARIVDAAGAAVTPGLMNAGTHLGLTEIGSVADASDEKAGKGPFGAAFDVQYALNPNSTLLPIVRADGLTRAGTIPGESEMSPFIGQGAVLRLSEGADILDRPKAAMFAAMGLSIGYPGNGSRGARWGLLRAALEEARSDRKGHRRGGGSLEGLAGRLDIEAIAAVLAGAAPLAILAHRESDLRQAIAVSRDFAVRTVIFGGAEAWRVADPLAEANIGVVLNPFDNLPATFDEVGARLDNAAILNAAGVAIAFWVPGIHFSHNAGLALREAAGVAVANGLPWAQAMRAVTVNPARTWGIGDHYGTVAAGMDADLVIWDGDPLEPASNPTAVFVRGEPVCLITRQSRLAERYHPKHRENPWPPAYR